MYRFLFTIALSFSISIGYSQNRSISGVVTNSEGLFLADAQVELTQTKALTYTAKNGGFSFNNLESGQYEILVKLIGYHPFSATVTPGAELKIVLQELTETLDEVEVNAQSIIGGSRGLRDIGGSSTYISPRELNRFNNTDPLRVLRTVPGVNIQEEDGFGLRPNIGMRGTGVERSSKITIMEDGVLAAPAPYTAPAAYYFPSVGRMNGVEVLKGSGSIKYGPFTTGGVLNFNTRNVPVGTEALAKASIGTFNTREMYAFAGAGTKTIGFSLEGLQVASDGFKQLDNGGNTGFYKSDFIAKTRIQLPGSGSTFQHGLKVKLGFMKENSNETYLGLTEEDFEASPLRRYAGSQVDNMDAQHQQLSLNYNARFKALDLSVTAYNNTFKRNWYKLDKVTDDLGNTYGIGSILDEPDSLSNALAILKGQSSALENSLHVKANNRSYLARGIQFQLRSVFKSNHITHHIESGFRVHYDEMDRFQWVDDYAMVDGVMQLTHKGQPGTESNRIESAMAYSGFVQYGLQLNQRLEIIPGLRYENIAFKKIDYGKNDPDRNETSLKTNVNYVDAFIPGVSATYALNTFNNVFAGIHKGFAPPGSTEGTLPESSVNYELGWRYTAQNLYITSTLFVNDYTNLLGSDLNAGGGAGTNEQFNAGEAHVLGAELSFMYDLLKNNTTWRLPVSGQYTYTLAQFDNAFTSSYEPWGNVEVGDMMPYLPMHQFSIQTAIENNRFNFTINARYTGETRTVAGSGNIPSNQLIPAALILDSSINYRLLRHVIVNAFVRNISNEYYLVSRRPAGLRPGLPRLIGGGLKVIL